MVSRNRCSGYTATASVIPDRARDGAVQRTALAIHDGDVRCAASASRRCSANDRARLPDVRQGFVIAWCAWAALSTGAGAVAATRDPSCPLQVVRVGIDDRADLEWLASWIEPWEVGPEGSWVVLGVDDVGMVRLAAAGLDVRIDGERTRELCTPPAPDLKQDGGVPGFPCYRTIEEGYRQAAEMAQRYPRLAQWIDVGDSWEKMSSGGEVGFDLRLLRLTNRDVAGTGAPGANDRKPVLMVLAGVHPRELAPVEAVIRFAEGLVRGYGREAEATWLLDEHEIHVVPFANPDGRTRAEAIAFWRKNADNEFCRDTPNRGVDLNRNFAHDWGCCGGSSGDPCSELFRGPSPASEPETRAYQTWMEQVFPDQWAPVPSTQATGVFVDVHSYGRLVMWPWGNVSELAPSWEGLETLGRRLAAKTGGTPQQSFDLYPSDGTTDDYAYARHGVAAFGFEIGDRFSSSRAWRSTPGSWRVRWPPSAMRRVWRARRTRRRPGRRSGAWR